MDFVQDLLDEIALEGLDGITVEGLWTRLGHRQRNKKFSLALDEDGKNFLWQRVIALPDLSFYELSSPRRPLVLFNRYDHMDADTGVVMEVKAAPDIYPIKIIGDGPKGSCAQCYERIEVTERVRKGMSLDDATREFGSERLVVVANQKRRWMALFGGEADPQLVDRLSDIQYCIMERIGRSRYHGEITQGESSLAVFGESVKTMHYHRMYLLKLNLITKQVHTQRGMNNQLYQGSLLMLKRFHVDRRSKYSIQLERLCEILHRKPNQSASLDSLRKEMGLDEKSFKKLYHNGNQNVRVVLRNYRDVYPNCTESEAKTKAGKEKTLRFIQLIKMYVYNALDPAEEDEDDDEEGVKGPCRREAIVIERPLLTQAFGLICKRGAQGTSQTELAACVGTPKLEARSLCRNLERHGVVKCIMEDEGRQRVTKYVAWEYEGQSELSLKFEQEKQKIMELSRKYNVGNVGDTPLINGGRRRLQSAAASSASTGDDEDRVKEGGEAREAGGGCIEDVTETGMKVVVDGVASNEEMDDPDYDPANQKKFVADKRAHHHQKRDNPHVTYRLLKRANLIITAVREHRLIDNIFQLQKMIIEEEEREGYANKIDKKSMLRLIERLAKDGHIKSIKTILKLGETTKQLHFVCEPNLSATDSVVKNAIEQSKVKFFSMPVAAKNSTTWFKSSSKMSPFDDEEDQAATDTPATSAKDDDGDYDDDDNNSKPSTSNRRKSGSVASVSNSSHSTTRKRNVPSSKNASDDDDDNNQEGSDGDTEEKAEERPKRKRRRTKSGTSTSNTSASVGANAHAEGAAVKPVPSSVQNSFEQMRSRLGASPAPDAKGGVGAGKTLTKDKANNAPKLLEYVPGIAKKYGVMPKMMRLQVVFEYMWYLAYGFDGRTSPIPTNLDEEFDNSSISGTESQPESTGIDKNKRNGYSDGDNPPTSSSAGQPKKQRRGPKLYRENELDWKMFVPPLPQHSGYPQGWVLISDALLAMPLSIFCQIITINYKVDDLSSYLEHPKKRHLLLRHLPSIMRQQLLHGRKYIFGFHEFCTRLCYMGLMSFGPHHFKEKDQVFVYVHRRGTIVDTTTADPHYNLVGTNKSYLSAFYDFKASQVVGKFWFDLQCICLNTPLGIGRGLRSSGGEWPILEALDAKKSLKECLRPLDPFNPGAESSPQNPAVGTGRIPGDGLGAGGLDSSFYAHMKRNWTWLHLEQEDRTVPKDQRVPRGKRKVRGKEPGGDEGDGDETIAKRTRRAGGDKSVVSSANPNERLPSLSNVHSRLTLDGETGNITSSTSTATNAPASTNNFPSFEIDDASRFKESRKGGKGLKRGARGGGGGNAAAPAVDKGLVKSRKIRPKKPKTPYYDAEDRLALKRMTKERVDWSTSEDSLLLLCRVTSSFMDDRKHMIVPWSCVRDVLHKHLPHSLDKTSKACQRRLNYVLKNAQTSLNVAVFLGEALQDAALVKEYRDRKYKITDIDNVAKTFVECLEMMRQKFKNNSLLEETASIVNDDEDELPSDKEGLLYFFDVKVSSGNLYSKSSHSDVANLVDIYTGVLHNLIHSTMSLDDKMGRSFELFKLFSQYPERLLHNVFNSMRKDQIISKMKAPTGPVGSGRRRRASLTLPFTALNYHFSQRYIYTFLSRYPVEIFYQAYNLLLSFHQSWSTKDEDDEAAVKKTSASRPELHPSFFTWDTGGSCAFVVSLMALEKIDFEVEIPEQIIVVDTNTMKTDVVRRGKLIKPIGGRKTASDEEDDQLLEQHFGEAASAAGDADVADGSNARIAKDASEATTSTAADANSPREARDPSQAAPRTTKVRFAEDDTEIARPEAESTHLIDIPARQASRINLALARNMSFRDINIRDINPQDNIVVNACSVKISPNRLALSLDSTNECHVINCVLKRKNNENNSLPVMTSAPLNHLQDEIFIKHEVRHELIKEELRTLPAKVCDVESLKKSLANVGFEPSELASAMEVVNFLHQKRNMGALLSEIYEQFPSAFIPKLLDALKYNDWLVKVGVTETRYVHYEFRRPWIIHSYKNLKGRGQWINANEKVSSLVGGGSGAMASPPPIILHDNSPSPGVTEDVGESSPLELVRESPAPSASASNRHPSNNLANAESQVGSPDPTVDNANEEIAGRRVSARQRRKSADKTATIASASEQTNFSKDGNYARVELVVRPWRKPDGNLNRPVLYMMLRSVLMYLMSFPGAPFRAVANKLSPTVQPVAVKELLDMLVDVGCVSRLYLKRSRTPSLFSPPSEILKRDDEWEGSEDAVYEPRVDCILKLGQILPELGESSVGHTADTINMFYEKNLNPT